MLTTKILRKDFQVKALAVLGGPSEASAARAAETRRAEGEAESASKTESFGHSFDKKVAEGREKDARQKPESAHSETFSKVVKSPKEKNTDKTDQAMLQGRPDVSQLLDDGADAVKIDSAKASRKAVKAETAGAPDNAISTPDDTSKKSEAAFVPEAVEAAIATEPSDAPEKAAGAETTPASLPGHAGKPVSEEKRADRARADDMTKTENHAVKAAAAPKTPASAKSEAAEARKPVEPLQVPDASALAEEPAAGETAPGPIRKTVPASAATQTMAPEASASLPDTDDLEPKLKTSETGKPRAKPIAHAGGEKPAPADIIGDKKPEEDAQEKTYAAPATPPSAASPAMALIPEKPPTGSLSMQERSEEGAPTDGAAMRATQQALKEPAGSRAAIATAQPKQTAAKDGPAKPAAASKADTPADFAVLLASNTADKAAPAPIASNHAAHVANTANGAEAARQIAASVETHHNGERIEIRLDPPELGRVHIHFSFDKGDNVTAVISSERSDTLSLLRRHSDELARELSNAGFANIQFEFSSSGGRDDFTQQPQSGFGVEDAANHEATEERVFHFVRRSDSLLDRRV